MRVASNVTLVTGSDSGPVDHAPRTPVELPEDQAIDLIARGIVWAVDELPVNPIVGEQQLPPADDSEKESPGTGEPMQEVAGDTLDNRLNINTATAEQISQTVAGIGIATARSIVKRREVRGPYQSLDELVKVSGVGKATVNKHRDLMTV